MCRIALRLRIPGFASMRLFLSVLLLESTVLHGQPDMLSFPRKAARGTQCFAATSIFPRGAEVHRAELCQKYDDSHKDVFTPLYTYDRCCRQEVAEGEISHRTVSSKVADAVCENSWLLNLKMVKDPTIIEEVKHKLACQKVDWHVRRTGRTVLIDNPKGYSIWTACVERFTAWSSWGSVKWNSLRFQELTTNVIEDVATFGCEVLLFVNNENKQYAVVFVPLSVLVSGGRSPQPHTPAQLQSKRPPSLYFLVLDSTSRLVARKFLPKTMSMLRGPLPGHECHLFDNFHSISNGGTLAFYSAFLFGGLPSEKGCTLDSAQVRTCKLDNLTHDIERCAGTRRLTLELQQAGYKNVLSATSWLHQFFHPDDVDFALPFIPCPVNVDVDDFETYHRKWGLSCHDMRCHGETHYFQDVLQYNDESLLWSNLQDSPISVISHLNAWHAAGLPFMDDILAEHVGAMSIRHPTTFIFVLGDHGDGVSGCDSSRPLLGVLAPKSGVTQGQQKILKRNRHKLVTPLDLRSMVRQIASLSQEGDHSGLSTLKRQSRKVYSHFGDAAYTKPLDLDGEFASFQPVSLLEDIPVNRSCEAAGLQKGHCNLQHREDSEKCVLCVGHTSLSASTKEIIDGRDCTWQPENEDHDFVCRLAGDGVYARLHAESIRLHQDCAPLALDRVELVFFGLVASVVFSTVHGEPPRVYEMEIAYDFQYTDYAFGKVKQLTSYRRYEDCVPSGADVMWCVCEKRPFIGGTQ